MEDELELFIRERKERVAQDRASFDIEPPYMEVLAKPHGEYGSLFKENIPPKLSAQEKDESSNIGLPLGLEYEKKKKQLQLELRMDYRSYIAQQNGARQRPPSRRDVATLTEASKEPHRAESTRNHISRDLLFDQESDEEKYTNNKLTEVKSTRQRGLVSSYEKQNKNDGREEGEIPSGFVIQDKRTTALYKPDETEFSTGLLIGVIDTKEVLQKRKERYRDELQEQIAENYSNKKRQKELELKVAATGANDPEKQPNRIRQFGLSRRKESCLLGHSILGQSESSSSSTGLPNLRGTGASGRRTPPPDKLHEAFQSPVCRCGTVDPNRGALSPVAVPFHRPVETSRTPLIPPHHLHSAYKGPFREPRYCNENRNLLDPNLAYYGHMPYPAAGLPLSYFNMPLEGAMPCQFNDASPQSGSSFPESSPQPNTDTVTIVPHIGDFAPEKPQLTSKRTLTYADELRKQIQEQQQRKRAEREAQERYDAKIETDMKRLQPWGRGGGGAPLKDSTGNLIADLKQMHKLNEVALSNPEQQQRALATNAVSQADPSESSITGHRGQLKEEACIEPKQQQRPPSVNLTCPVEPPDPNNRISGFTHVQMPQAAPQQLTMNAYRAGLDQQIKEKRQKQAEERERARLEEEKDARSLDEYYATVKRRSEEQQEKKKQNEMEKRAKKQELLNLAEQSRMEEERKKIEEREKAQKKQHEQEQHVLAHREPHPEDGEKAQQNQCGREQRVLVETFHREATPEERKKPQKKQHDQEQKALVETIHRKPPLEDKNNAQKKQREQEQNTLLEALHWNPPPEQKKIAQKKQHEQEQQALIKTVYWEPPSPDLQRSQNTPRPPIAESSRSTAPLSERSLSGHQSPPVPACRNQLRASANKIDLYSGLSVLRRQLRAEQRRLETHLQQGDCDDTDYLMSGRKSKQQVDVFEMARLNRQAPVRNLRSRNMEPSNLLRIHDSLQLNYLDDVSRLGSNEVEWLERVGIANRREQVYNDPRQTLSSQRSTRTNDYFDTSPPCQRDLGNVLGRQASGSLLESDSAFLGPLGDDFPVPSSPEAEETAQLSARERRRLTKQSQHSPERENAILSGIRRQGEAESCCEEKSEENMLPCRRGNTAGTVDLSDDDDLLPPQISHLTHNRQSSMESFSTDHWLRPSTSETVKCLENLVKRDRLTT
ncbi:centrosome and spindle pole-associated protein 1-like isoform X2 [Stigmatopora argus]